MVHELWDTLVLLIPIFFLLTLIFSAGFVIGRISIGRIGKREQ